METQSAARIVADLRLAFSSGRTRPLSWRKAQLSAMDRMLEERETELREALRQDLGKPPFEAYASEIGFVRMEIRHASKNLARWARPQRARTTLAQWPSSCRIVRGPLGVVLVIGPWNYPLQLVLSPLVAAVAAGNTAAVKPSELAPASSRALASLLPRYVDAECFKVVEGGVEAATALLGERFDHVLFTGSASVARAVMAAAAKTLTPVTLELGGKSPCLVDRDADLPVTAARIAWGKFWNAGQTCVAPDYVLVHREVEEELVAQLGKAVTAMYGDDPRTSPSYGRIVDARHVARLASLLDGGEIALGGAVDEAERYVAPTILRRVKPEATVMTEEIFGPILPVLPVSGMDEAVDFVNARATPLALYVFARDGRTIDSVLARTSSGGACVNDTISHITVPGLPFGGVGPSGMGAYRGRAGFDTFSHARSVLDKPFWPDVGLRYPPWSERRLGWLRRLL
jgi:aldehyde dehydrogenase (NAD+)